MKCLILGWINFSSSASESPWAMWEGQIETERNEVCREGMLVTFRKASDWGLSR